MREYKVLSTLEEIKAFSDPYRLQILTALRDFQRPATVKEISDELDETPAKVHYHVKKLEKAHIVELVDTKEVNGIIAKYYLPTAERFELNSTNQNKELSKVILNETQRVINNVYNSSKKLLIDQLNKHSEITKAHKPDIHSVNVYLSDDDVEELTTLFEKFTSRRFTDEEKKKLTKYHLFTAHFPIVDED